MDNLEEFLKLPRGTLPQVAIITHNSAPVGSRDVFEIPLICLHGASK